ncbi:MAG: hypothetical protein B7Z05_03275 [Thiotrichales bacterium 32-46-8]|nr:MAG: hypothetical protein B7Z05_03275 [Thiotrichales bacterium 32-46-8]
MNKKLNLDIGMDKQVLTKEDIITIIKYLIELINSKAEIDDIDLPGYQLHPLKGARSGIWSISVNGNWRITFEFVDGNAYILNYEDYH